MIKTWNIFSTFNLKKCATTLFQVEGGGGVDKLLRADDGIFDKGEYKRLQGNELKNTFIKACNIATRTSHLEKYIQESRNQKHFCF